MHIFSSNYEDLNFDFVIYLNPLYNDYDNDDQDIYHPQYYKYLENELPLKYFEEAAKDSRPHGFTAKALELARIENHQEK